MFENRILHVNAAYILAAPDFPSAHEASDFWEQLERDPHGVIVATHPSRVIPAVFSCLPVARAWIREQGDLGGVPFILRPLTVDIPEQAQGPRN